jgi:hypothetical protein
MNRWAFAAVVVLGTVPMFAQDGPTNLKVAEITWRPVYDSMGNRSSVPVFSRSASDRSATLGRVTFNEQSEVLRVDEQLRHARLANDVQSMERLLSDEFFETNQNGKSTDKSQALELWSTFKISSLATERATIRLAGNIATMTGEQTEVNATGTERMLFARVYVRSEANGWQLLSSTQFRNPKL